MRLLLDTHTLLWFYQGDARLSPRALDAILDPTNEKLVSPASYWELAIKVGLGKYDLRVSFGQFIQEAIYDNGFAILPILPNHASALVGLPSHSERRHKDPFDRLLIAQAIVEDVPIVSVDDKFHAYSVVRIW